MLQSKNLNLKKLALGSGVDCVRETANLPRVFYVWNVSIFNCWFARAPPAEPPAVVECFCGSFTNLLRYILAINHLQARNN